DFSLRAQAKNFNRKQIKEAIDYTHKIGKKIYITLNIYFTPLEMDRLVEYFKLLNDLKPDGIILSDFGALFLAQIHAPSIPVHISTQANITNQYAVKLLENFNVQRVILARELTLNEIKKIHEAANVELEAFIHGAMCISYSGRCLLSAYMTHPALGKKKEVKSDEIRSANKGNCSHSCRWEYDLLEKSRPEQKYSVSEDQSGTYIFSSKDICMIDHIGDLLKAGVSSFKIEGRMKSILYISSIVRAYRAAIDHYFDKKIKYDRKIIENELNIVSHREFCTGFFYNNLKKEANITKGGLYKREIRLLALILDVKGKRAVLKVYNSVCTDDKIEYIAPLMCTKKIKKIFFYDKNNDSVNKINHNEYAEAEMWDENDNVIIPQKHDILRVQAQF
ncbi:MAG: U32 family peptidase, partial [Spirochaetes bacterium]|nr:U32 family peptidase [Spirochaetota bacterium]